MVWRVFFSLLPTFICLIVVFLCVIAAEWTKTHFLYKSQKEMMVLGRINLRQFPQGRRWENAQFQGKTTWFVGPLRRDADACSPKTILRRSQLHLPWWRKTQLFLLSTCWWVFFRECCSTYFHSVFPLPALMTNSGSRVSVLSSAWQRQRPGLIATLLCLYVVQVSIPDCRHLCCFSLYHDVFMLVPLPHLLCSVCARHRTHREYQASNLIEV